MLFKQYKCSYKLLEDLSDEVLKIPQNKIHKHIKYNDDTYYQSFYLCHMIVKGQYG